MSLICTGRNVLLPDVPSPVPATFTVDLTTGKIVHIDHDYQSSDSRSDDPAVQWIDAGSNYVLPGLVEYVSNDMGF